MLAGLPIAVAIALSPFAIIPAIVALLTPRPLAAAGASLAGWAVGIALVSGLTLATSDLIELSGGPVRWRTWAALLLGTALLLLGILRWRRRHQGGPPPVWLQEVRSATPRRALLFGLALSVANPKVLLLAIAGGLAIAASAPPGRLQEVTSVLAFTLVASLSVALPWLAFLLARERAVPRLDRLRHWLEVNANAVMAVVFVVLGGALLARSLPMTR